LTAPDPPGTFFLSVSLFHLMKTLWVTSSSPLRMFYDFLATIFYILVALSNIAHANRVVNSRF
ncbi:MAG: hypothetical protein K6G24_04495, partial [Lachnospiraceae bacterium]|nr:hypothetical protein [Lachnospiraceae bacterium]